MFLRFPHLAKDIFNLLDDRNLAKSREGSKSFRKFIDDEKITWKRIKQKYPCRDGQNLLHIAALTGQFETFEKLSEDESDINPKDAKERTPLHFAAENGHFSICQWIISNVKDKNPKDAQGWTPLH